MSDTPTPRDQIAAALWENGRLAHLGEPPWSELDDDRRGVPYEEADLILALPFITEMQERVKRVDIDKAFHDVAIAERNLAWYQFGKRDARIAELEAEVAAEHEASVYWRLQFTRASEQVAELSDAVREMRSALAATERAVKIAAAVDAELCRSEPWQQRSQYNALLHRLRAAGQSS